MEFTKSILEDIRVAVGLSKDVTDFDDDLLMHINNAIATLRQNGVTNLILVSDTSKTWDDLKDPSKGDSNEFFQMVPLFIALSTKMVFDPPPPSAVEYQANVIEGMLWRLKVAYEDFSTTDTSH